MRALFGAIAQLGERVNGIHEVGSSILPGSTIFFNRLFYPLKPGLDTVPNQLFCYRGEFFPLKVNEL